MHATPPGHPQCNYSDEDTMAKRTNDGVELIKTLAGNGRGGSRPKPPEAVARGASLGAPRPLPDHEKAKRCLTANTVALSRRRSPKIQAPFHPGFCSAVAGRLGIVLAPRRASNI